MKHNHIFLALIAAVICQSFMACSPAKNGFTGLRLKKHYTWVPANKPVQEDYRVPGGVELIKAEVIPMAPGEAPVLTASIEPVVHVEAIEIPEVIIEDEAPAMTKKEARKVLKNLKKDILFQAVAEEKPAVTESAMQLPVPKAGSATILEVILAILLPPLAVFLHSGLKGVFWVDLILTLLFWIPGVIFAFLVIFDVIK